MVEPSEGNTPGTQDPVGVSTKQRRIAELAGRYPQRVFISLNHYMDDEWLYEAYERTRKDGAVGIDGVTAQAYACDLQANLQGLLERLKSGRYHAPAVRRVYIEEQGTPQGAVVSPILANVFLHEVLDTWFHREVVPRLRGRSSMVRYADDVICVFECREDCERVRAVMEKRPAKYGLTLHPTKTRIVEFCGHKDGDKPSGGHTADTFDFLGFTHLWKRSRRGAWVVMRQTAKKRLARSLRRVYEYCRRHRHAPLGVQHQYLCRLLRGHYAYYGIIGNARGIRNFAYQVRRIWHKWLKRRNGLRRLIWTKFNGMLTRLTLPPPRIVHTFGWRPLSEPAL